MTGQLLIRNLSIQGTTSVRVEEYKRPKFYTEIEKPAAAVALGQKVTMQGKATAYTGAAIDGATVTWRVVRTVRYPRWCYCRFWYLPFDNASQEIANGTSTTDVEGKFNVDFVAQPDASVDRKYQPVFQYLVYADVTDGAGETRSAQQSTSIGYTSLEAKLEVKDWQTVGTDVAFDVKVDTLDGEGQAVAGTLKIHRLKSPDKVHRA